MNKRLRRPFVEQWTGALFNLTDKGGKVQQGGKKGGFVCHCETATS